MQVAVVGGGAGGVEMCLSLNHMLRQQHAAGQLPPECKPQVTYDPSSKFEVQASM